MLYTSKTFSWGSEEERAISDNNDMGNDCPTDKCLAERDFCRSAHPSSSEPKA